VVSLPPAKKSIVTRLIHNAQAKPDDGVHYVFSGYPNSCHAVIETNSDEQKCYVMYELFKDRVQLLGSGFCFCDGNQAKFDFEMYSRDELIALGGLPPW
jgi:hypothetical protein